MEGASTRSKPDFGVMIMPCCCQLRLTKEPFKFPPVPVLWVGWCQPSWGQQDCSLGLSLQTPTEAEENLSSVQA